LKQTLLVSHQEPILIFHFPTQEEEIHSFPHDHISGKGADQAGMTCGNNVLEVIPYTFLGTGKALISAQSGKDFRQS
jgi:hypothetical protein